MERRANLEGTSIVRFIAAMMVVSFHVALMPPLEMSEHLRFITNFGGFGVPLFYILSAFMLSYGYRGQLDSAEQMRRFYTRRFWRIAPLFYVMMAFYFAYLWVMHRQIVDPAKLLTSATFTMNLVPGHVTGFVFASWSIGVEMLFYAVFPLLVLAITNVWRAAAFFVGSVGILVLWTNGFASAEGELKQFGTFSLIAHLHYFSLGMLAYFIWRTVPWRPALHRAVAVVAVCLLVALVLWSGTLQQWMGHPLLTVCWGMALTVLAIGLSFEKASRLVRPLVMLGEASFSLYLLHPAIIAVMIHGGLYKWIYSVIPGHFLAYALSLAATLAVLFPLSLLTYEQIEKRFRSGWGRKLQPVPVS
jgi:peptidoglycan/LPS O-acetylase OafA/YrhL